MTASANSMRRRLLGAAGALALLPSGILAAGATPKRIIWVLNLGTEESRKRSGDPRDLVRRFFASRGIEDGRDIALTFEDLPAGNRRAESEALAEKLLRSRPDVIVMVASGALIFLKRRTRDIPVVFYHLGADPVRAGLVESLRRPGANFTGTTLAYEDQLSRKWQLLKEIAPWIRRGGVLCEKEFAEEWVKEWERDSGLVPRQRMEKKYWDDLHRAAGARLGIEIEDVRLPRNATMNEIAAIIRKSRVQGLYLEPPLPVERAGEFAKFAEFLKSSRIPAVGPSFASVKAGLLIGTSWEWDEGVAYSVEIVDRILRGASPATIPVYQIRGFEVAINRTTARAMGIEIPHSLLIQAREIFD